MSLVFIVTLLLASGSSRVAGSDSGDRSHSNEEHSIDTNEIIPREAIQRLDYSVRQALLRAIDKLEKESASGNRTDSENGMSVAESTMDPYFAQDMEMLEESTNSADVVKPTVHFFTATFNEKLPREQLLEEYVNTNAFGRKLPVAQKLKQQQNVSSTTILPTNVIYAQSSDQRFPIARSVNSGVQDNEIVLQSIGDVKFEIRKTKLSSGSSTTASVKSTVTSTSAPLPRTTRRPRPTTTTTTTTTTPRPTHNEDGENIEVVDKNDIKILSAPLVSAFSVDLDERGGTKKVVSLVAPRLTGSSLLSTAPTANGSFSASTSPTISSGLHSNRYNGNIDGVSNAVIVPPASGHYITKSPSSIGESNRPHFPLDSNFNNFLIEKQRQLEQQIYQLKLQAQQQQELILRQFKLLEDQNRFRGNGIQGHLQPPLPIPPPPALPTQQQQQQQQQQFLHQQQQYQLQQHPILGATGALRADNPSFTIRPSLEFASGLHSELTRSFPGFPLPAHLNAQHTTLKRNNDKFPSNDKLNSVMKNFANNLLTAGVQQHNLQQPQQQQQQLSTIAFNNNNNNNNNNVQIQPSHQLKLPGGSTEITSGRLSLAPPGPPLDLVLQGLPHLQPPIPFQTTTNTAQTHARYVPNALLDRGQQQEQQQHHRVRFFRQNSDTGNFGLNAVPNNVQQQQQQQQLLQQQQQFQQQFLENQNFYRQHLNPQLSTQLEQNARKHFQQHQQQQQFGRHQQEQQLPTQQLIPQLALNHGIPSTQISNSNSINGNSLIDNYNNNYSNHISNHFPSNALFHTPRNFNTNF